MEIEDQDGAKMELSYGRNNCKAVFGRDNGFSTDDRTVSRSHVAFEVNHGAKQAEPRVSFEVLGKNPVWVRRNEDEEIRVFRSSENGELSEGDWFCLSGNEPTWFALRNIRTEDWETRVLDEEDESDLGSSSRIGTDFDVSEIDPVKEFGFVVMGHEFDIYPRHMIRDGKKWDWFLEEDRKENSDDEEEEEEEFEKRKQKGLRKKRKKGQEMEDEDWAGESEDDKEVVGTIRKGIRPKKYTTRLKDRGKKPHKDGQGSKSSSPNKIYSSGEDEDYGDNDDDEEDETLGGFIVGDNDMDVQEEEINEDDDDEEEEEEELVEDDDEEEDE